MTNKSLTETMHQLLHAYKQLMHEGIQKQRLDLPVTHLRALKGVCHNPKITAQMIAKRMQRDKAQITRALNDLIKAKLIIKTDNPLDGRSQLLKPTARGKQVIAQLQTAETWATEQLTQNLSGDELEHFMKVSQTMIRNGRLGRSTES